MKKEADEQIEKKEQFEAKEQLETKEQMKTKEQAKKKEQAEVKEQAEEKKQIEHIKLYLEPSEYFSDILKLIRQLLNSYIKQTVVIEENKMVHMRGMSYFYKDIVSLEKETFNKEELMNARYKREQILKQYTLILQKVKLSAKKKVIIPLEYLFQIFKLTNFERICIFLSFTVELDYRFERIYSYLQDDYGKKLPSLDLCLHIYSFEEEERCKILTEFIERKKIMAHFFPQLKEGSFSSGNITKPLKLSQRILTFLFHVQETPENLIPYIKLEWPYKSIQESLIIQKEIGEKIENYIYSTKGKHKIFCLYGEEGSGKQFQLRHFCHRVKLTMLKVNFTALPNQIEELKKIMEEILFEAMIQGAVLCFLHFEHFFEKEEQFKNLFYCFLQQIWEFSEFIFILTTKKWKTFEEEKIRSEIITIPLLKTTVEERVLLWKELLRKLPVKSNLPIEQFAVKFQFSPAQIKKSIQTAIQKMDWQERTELDDSLLNEACYEECEHNLEKKAVRIHTSYLWEDLILPKRQKELLQLACDQIRCSHIIYNTWNFGEKIKYGKGVSILFYGPPGTGKTMGAEVIANELQMELYKVDLSTIMSKYIGETEKNLECLFEEVKKSSSILFFDEADALFGKRSEIKDSHDKYANVETAYLLQKIEQYDGIVILATNYMQNFDEAYKRRLKFMIHFPFPEKEQRKALWKSVYPKAVPMSKEIDFDFLAEHFELSGSNIKNIAVNSAFLAVSKKASVMMEDIIFALQIELEKYGKKLGKEELGQYYMIDL